MLLGYTDMACTRISGKNKDSFSFATFASKTTVDYTSSVVNGQFLNVPYGPL
jgi:hypothetical protein